MAERGALSLLSLLCLTSLYTETTAAKHVDKGKTLTDTAAVLMCVCGFTPLTYLHRVELGGIETNGMLALIRRVARRLILPCVGQILFRSSATIYTTFNQNQKTFS